MPIVQC